MARVDGGQGGKDEDMAGTGDDAIVAFGDDARGDRRGHPQGDDVHMEEAPRDAHRRGHGDVTGDPEAERGEKTNPGGLHFPAQIE